jgi:hypothetical protein
MTLAGSRDRRLAVHISQSLYSHSYLRALRPDSTIERGQWIELRRFLMLTADTPHLSIEKRQVENAAGNH